jgi:hypothetical protein
MEQTYGDFTFGESMRILKMAFSRYYKNYALNVQSGETAALLTMLERGCIKCSSHSFQLVKNLTEGTQAEVDQMAGVLRKKSYSRILCNALHVFSEHQPDMSRVKYGALYYPDLKLYTCVGYLTPKVLLCLFAEPDCEQVAVFAAMAKWERKNHYLLFERSGPWEEYSRVAKSCNLPFLKQLKPQCISKNENTGLCSGELAVKWSV